ncbi:MAG: hypoxanthine phosphoribosyltransferase [Vampirovibrionales bacterium]|nr:hypoxanthine phosphoribosyltransferase [Vampirovibrionales bacterium]
MTYTLTTDLPEIDPKTQYSLDELQPFFTESQLQERIQLMGEAINKTYAGCERLVIVSILKGAFMFAADLVRHIDVPCQIEFVRLASYGNSRTSSGTVKPVDLTLPDLSGQDVLVLEDIVDTGLTLHFFMDYLRSLHHTKSLRLAVLLDKVNARSKEIPAFPIDFSGFEVGDEFLVGYGLDYAGYYRNFPYIAQLPSE